MDNHDVAIRLRFIQPSPIFILVQLYSQPVGRECELRIDNLHIPDKYP